MKAAKTILASMIFVNCQLVLCQITPPPSLEDLQANSAPKLKGHTIGETFQEYLSELHNGPAYLQTCQEVKNVRQARKQGVDLGVCRFLISALGPNQSFTMDFSPVITNYMPPATEHNAAKFKNGRLVLLRFTVGEDPKILLV